MNNKSLYQTVERFFKLLANPSLFFVYYHPFHITNQLQIEKKHRWSAWDTNPGPQGGRRRQNHRAMAATQQWRGKFKVIGVN